MPRPILQIPNEQHMPVNGMPVESGQVVAETFTHTHNNQPSVLNGYLVLAGNADFSTWNIEDRANPQPVAEMTSQHNAGEAESHQVAFAKYGEKYYMVTTSGRGFDMEVRVGAGAVVRHSVVGRAAEVGPERLGGVGRGAEGEGHPGAGVGEGVHDGAADAARAAGDQRLPALQLQVHQNCTRRVSAPSTMMLAPVMKVASPVKAGLRYCAEECTTCPHSPAHAAT